MDGEGEGVFRILKTHDPAIFAIIVPTFEGTRFLKRMLDYFLHIGFEGRIVLSDNSSGEHRDFVASCPGRYRDLQIETHLYPRDIRFLDKMVDTLGRIDARFVMLHAHDDFMVHDAVDRCVDFLDSHPGYSVARGRIAMFRAARGAAPGEIGLSPASQKMHAYEQDDPLERVLDHLDRYGSTFYSVHARASLVEAFALTERATKNVIFFQYLSSCICALNGKVWCSDELFYVRQGHGDSWSGTLRQGDYEHWPMLITSPHFSGYYQEFRNALSTLLEEKAGVPVTDAQLRIDRAAVNLFRRSFCGIETDDPSQQRFAKSLTTPGSEENRFLHAIGGFVGRYPDTV